MMRIVFLLSMLFVVGQVGLSDAVAQIDREIGEQLGGALGDLLGGAPAQVGRIPIQGRPWGPEQAAGKPDTPNAGDIQTAWASATQDGQEEWLELSYQQEVVPTEVEVHETFNPGAVFKVSVFSADNRENVVWQGKDPTPVGALRGVSKIKLQTRLKTKRIRIYLNSAAVAGWNEIDAVGLRGKDAPLQWADKVTASSTFAAQAQAFVPVAGRDGVVIRELPLRVAPPVINANVQADRMVQERERQMAQLIKLIRAKDREIDELKQLVEQLQAENQRLRKAPK